MLRLRHRLWVLQHARHGGRAALAAALADPAAREAKAALLLDGVDDLPIQAYGRIVEMEAAALGHGYFEMHATSAALG